MKGQDAGHSQLSRARRRLSDWRERHGGRGRPIPEEIWAEAVAVAREHGVAKTARELKLDGRRLRRLSDGEPTASTRLVVSEAAVQTEFVELDTSTLCTGSRTVVHLEGGDGERVRLEVSGAIGADVLTLARAFWSRGR